jgi:pyroglutamyl-peptidase
MSRVLVTSFEPFGGHDINSSHEVGRTLSQRPPPGVEIDWLVLPVVAGECILRAWQLVEARGPEMVLALGQAGSSPLVRLEDRAVNFDHFHFADNAGNLHRLAPVVPGGPAIYRTPLPLPHVLHRLRQTVQPIEHSFSAGNYICNHYYYQLLHRAAQSATKPRVLFVHLPLLPSQLRPPARWFARPLEEQVECVRQILLACLESTHETAGLAERAERE